MTALPPERLAEIEALLACPGAADRHLYRRAIRDLLAERETREWLPIESAPETPDTQPLPVYSLMYNGYHIGVGWRQMPDDPEFGPRYWSETGEPIEPPPTHWMPLPEPPHE